MPRIELPDPLRRRPFALGDPSAELLSKGRLLGPDLARPTRSVRSAVPLTSTVQRAWAFALAMPEDVAFCHETAARLWDLPLPSPDAPDRPLHVIRDNRHNRIRRTGVVGHRGLESRSIARCRGLPVVGQADTWLDLAEVLGADDLVVIGDCIATRAQSVVPLVEALRRRRRMPKGSRDRAVRSLQWVRVGAASAMESRARLVVVGAGLPEPELNATIHDALGEWVATGDLVWRKQRVVGEYQGEQAHHGPRARRVDSDRRAVLEEELGWTVVEIFKDDVFNPGRRHRLVTRVARHLGIDPSELTL
ncbi:hypothetical protein N865_16595 [Intrasporangium oryzae NRRL B-24470]|uniref:DUF559 domain-containing protein n=1 Tax=Intrasporangium oryzae NRRL B-24470 TaxID=1386089 RepID=W9G8M3_9MICO|nr:hypothetical protein [Intrasporangium oryzae]EWT00224.1 hypothetical protein N865_16595 [Intrasporangium oryzae NRRL B-24470]